MLYLTIDTGSEIPVYVQIMDRIRGLVRDGKLAPGTSLPSVRQLANDLGINPNTVSKAYGLLEREHILETARRRGTIIAGTAVPHATKAVEDRLEIAVERVLEETASVGIDVDQLIDALSRRSRKRRRKTK